MSDPDMGQSTVFTAEGSLALLLYLLLKHLKYLTEKRSGFCPRPMIFSIATPEENMATILDSMCEEPFQMQLCHSSLRGADEEPLLAP